MLRNKYFFHYGKRKGEAEGCGWSQGSTSWMARGQASHEPMFSVNQRKENGELGIWKRMERTGQCWVPSLLEELNLECQRYVRLMVLSRTLRNVKRVFP